MEKKKWVFIDHCIGNCEMLYCDENQAINYILNAIKSEINSYDSHQVLGYTKVKEDLITETDIYGNKHFRGDYAIDDSYTIYANLDLYELGYLENMEMKEV